MCRKPLLYQQQCTFKIVKEPFSAHSVHTANGRRQQNIDIAIQTNAFTNSRTKTKLPQKQK